MKAYVWTLDNIKTYFLPPLIGAIRMRQHKNTVNKLVSKISMMVNLDGIKT